LAGRPFALQSIGIIHFQKDFLPRISRMPRMENSLIFIRGIREIRGCISFVAALPRCDYVQNSSSGEAAAFLLGGIRLASF
jgi:hypothetical protein